MKNRKSAGKSVRILAITATILALLVGGTTPAGAGGWLLMGIDGAAATFGT